jgi:GlpG protein
MRLIGHVEHEDDAVKITEFLKRQGMDASLDASFEPTTGQMTYQIWAHDEDRLDEAKKELEKFKKNPRRREYEIPSIEEEVSLPVEEASRLSSPFTVFIIGLCIFIYFFNFLEEVQNPGVFTSIQKGLFFDFPPVLEKAKSFAEVEQTPIWTGFYHWIVAKITGQELRTGPLFIKIREGEIWRLFSPAILHTNWLHILFNMLWVWILSRMVEFRIGMFKLLILSAIIALISNLAQYLMGGPFFLGYSGVVLGLAGFIWMREKVAPWEGYPLPKSTFLFLIIYVFGMFLVQVAAFFLQIFTNIQFTPIIANTAHIVGAIVGGILGKLRFFSHQVKR